MQAKELSEEQKNRLFKYSRMSFVNLRLRILNELIANGSESAIYKRYKKEEVVEMLKDPKRNENRLRRLSSYLYSASGHYRRLIDYFASLLLFNYTIITDSTDKKGNFRDSTLLREAYTAASKECEKLNLRQEGIKAIKIAVRDGVFYGLCYECENSFYIKNVDSAYCRISSIEDGTFVFEFDLSYFNDKKELLSSYGKNFEEAYKLYRGSGEQSLSGIKSKRWFEPENGICIKADETDPFHSLPLFTGLILDIFTIEDMKMLQKARKENDNYKALALKLPTDEAGIPLLDFEKNKPYYDHIVNNIDNEGIGVFMSPFDVTDFSFATNKNSDVNDVIDSEEQFWMGSGVNALLFGSAKARSSSSIALSVKPDEQLAYTILLQFERFFNKKLKKDGRFPGCRLKFIPQSVFNSADISGEYLKAAKAGLPAKLLYGASLGLSPLDMLDLTHIEEDIFSLGKSKWIAPLYSSAENETENAPIGRPTNESKGLPLTEEGELSQEDDLSGDYEKRGDPNEKQMSAS